MSQEYYCIELIKNLAFKKSKTLLIWYLKKYKHANYVIETQIMTGKDDTMKKHIAIALTALLIVAPVVKPVYASIVENATTTTISETENQDTTLDEDLDDQDNGEELENEGIEEETEDNEGIEEDAEDNESTEEESEDNQAVDEDTTKSINPAFAGLPYGLAKREVLPAGLDKKETLPPGLQKKLAIQEQEEAPIDTEENSTDEEEQNNTDEEQVAIEEDQSIDNETQVIQSNNVESGKAKKNK